MSGKLEDYLKEGRAGLDVENPDDETVWSGIEKKLLTRSDSHRPERQRSGWIRVRNVAAVCLLMFCLGYITKDIINTIGAGKKVTLSSIDSELGKREDGYKQLMSLKYHDVDEYRNTDNPVVRELFKELEKLDTIYIQSINDLKILGPNDKVINTIFDTYENRIRLLELIVLETNRTKNHEKNEKIRL
jgi:hypothetical protein